MVVQTAPSVRVSIGEELGLAPGTVETGQMVAAQRALGFDYVFDSNFSADLTIMEEGGCSTLPLLPTRRGLLLRVPSMHPLQEGHRPGLAQWQACLLPTPTCGCACPNPPSRAIAARRPPFSCAQAPSCCSA